MSGEKKVYVIDPGSPDSKADMSSRNGKEEKGIPADPSPSKESVSCSRNGSRKQKDDRESGISLIFAYLAGPLSIFATRRGRRSRFLVGLALSSIVLSLIVMVIWSSPGFWSGQETPAGALLLAAAVLAVISGTAAWANAVILAGQHEGPRLRRSPGWIRGPVAAGIFGVVSPGMGLFVASRFRHAAAAVWIAGVTVISVILLSRSGWLWEFNSHAGVFAVRPDLLEYILIGVGVVAVTGLLSWVAQALNGLRLARQGSNRKSVQAGNWAAVSLLVSVIAFLAFSRPAVLAETFDAAAASSGSRGMRIIPLQLSQAATRLDPARPAYVIRTIGLYEQIGDQASADRLRTTLIGRLQISVPLLKEEGLIPSDGGVDSWPIAISFSGDSETGEGLAIPTIPAGMTSLDWSLPQARD